MRTLGAGAGPDGDGSMIGGIAFSVWWQRNKNTEKVRGFVDPIKLKMPVFGSLMKKLAPRKAQSMPRP